MKIGFRLIATVFVILTMTSCNQEQKQEAVELEIKHIPLNKTVSILKESDKSEEKKITDVKISSTFSEKKNLSNIENLIGYWFTPHFATINIKFDSDGRFEFNDYNSNLKKEEQLTGEFTLQNGTLTLIYDDRPKQNFIFYKGEDSDNSYYIKKDGYYFVKGEKEDSSIVSSADSYSSGKPIYSSTTNQIQTNNDYNQGYANKNNTYGEQEAAIVVLKKNSCDYMILENSNGYVIAQWMGGNDPEKGDKISGNFHTFGTHDFYNLFNKSTSRLWIDDYMLSKNRALEKIGDKCN